MFKVHHSAVHLHKFASVIIIFQKKIHGIIIKHTFSAYIARQNMTEIYFNLTVLLSLMSVRVISLVKESFTLSSSIVYFYKGEKQFNVLITRDKNPERLYLACREHDHVEDPAVMCTCQNKHLHIVKLI